MLRETTRYEVLNQLCDADSLWGALLFLRPARSKPLSAARLLLICVLFSFFYGMCANAVFAITQRLGGRPALPVYVAPVFLALTSYSVGLLFFARAWNRRAQLLARKEAWVDTISEQPRR